MILRCNPYPRLQTSDAALTLHINDFLMVNPEWYMGFVTFAAVERLMLPLP